MIQATTCRKPCSSSLPPEPRCPRLVSVPLFQSNHFLYFLAFWVQTLDRNISSSVQSGCQFSLRNRKIHTQRKATDSKNLTCRLRQTALSTTTVSTKILTTAWTVPFIYASISIYAFHVVCLDLSCYTLAQEAQCYTLATATKSISVCLRIHQFTKFRNVYQLLSQ